MVVVIQALVIMFTGALDNMVRMPLERLFARRPRATPLSPPGPTLHPPGRMAPPSTPAAE